MAWFSSGSTNEELALALKGHDIIKTNAVFDAFRAVDRAHFVPRNMLARAYKDYPIREGNVHLSAPHIYAQVLEALELYHGASFLNIGSGTGYMSCLAGAIIGKGAMNHGLEVDSSVIEACQRALAMYTNNPKKSSVSQEHDNQMEISDDEDENDDPEEPQETDLSRNSDHGICKIVHGDIFLMDVDKNVKYDRIYIGAGAPERLISTIKSLLNPFGIAVGPFGDKLLKIRRRDSYRFSEIVLSNVTFAAMRENSDVNNEVDPICYFPPQVWNTSMHSTYPRPFKDAVMALLMSNSHVPSNLWMRIFEYFPYDWFNKEMSEMEKLQVLLEMESNAREEAEKRALHAENERDKFRLLLWRQQNQIQHLMTRLNRDEEGGLMEQEDESSEEEEIDMEI